MTKIANTIDSSIVMEAAVPSDFETQKLPLLNCQIWIEKDKNGQKIRYEHYSKPMASILEVQNESAMPDKMKRATLVQGGITRLLNTSIELGEEKQNEILSKYMKKLQSSNYSHKTRLQILKSIKNGWKKILSKAQSGERPLHRHREFEEEKRINDKESKMKNWFKQDGKFESVFMIPATPDSILKKFFEEKAKIYNLKIKFVERSGMKLGNYLKKFDKTNMKEQCGQKDCMICKHSEKTNTKCRIPNIVYKISCIECEKEKIRANYYGETSFNGYTRGIWHLDKYKSKNQAL